MNDSYLEYQQLGLSINESTKLPYYKPNNKFIRKDFILSAIVY